MNINGKTPTESYTEQVHIVDQSDLNGAKRLFGGQLLAWVDVVAGITARRHTGYNAVTAAIDNLSFLAPAYADDLVTIIGKVTYCGNTSIEVCVKSFVERNDGSRKIINKAYFVMVALDKDGNKVSVPPLIPQTEEEREEFEAGRRRRALRKKRSIEKY